MIRPQSCPEAGEEVRSGRHAIRDSIHVGASCTAPSVRIGPAQIRSISDDIFGPDLAAVALAEPGKDRGPDVGLGRRGICPEREDTATPPVVVV